MTVLGIFVFVGGFLMWLKPSLIWELTESWKSNNGTEPSDFYVSSTRFNGILCIIVGSITITAAFL